MSEVGRGTGKRRRERVGDEMVCPDHDELSRSGMLEETQHVYNAALILKRAIQLLQPITPFPAEPADLSKRKSMHMFQVRCTIFSHG